MHSSEEDLDTEDEVECQACGKAIARHSKLCKFCWAVVDPDASPAVKEDFHGLWRKDDLLVVRKGTRLPNICIKTNLPTEDRFTRNLTWFSGWVWLTILVGWLIFLIVMLATRKTATIDFGLSEEFQTVRRIKILHGLSAMFFGAAFLFLSGFEPLCIIPGIFLFLGGAYYANTHSQIITASRIEGEYVYIKGVHLSFLGRLRNMR